MATYIRGKYKQICSPLEIENILGEFFNRLMLIQR